MRFLGKPNTFMRNLLNKKDVVPPFSFQITSIDLLNMDDSNKYRTKTKIFWFLKENYMVL